MTGLFRPKPAEDTPPVSAEYDLTGTEIDRLKQEVKRGDFTEIRQYLARTKRARDWQDRCFLLNSVGSSIHPEAIIAASAREPNAADLLLLLGTYYHHMLGQSRGSGAAENVSDEQFRGAGLGLQNMMSCLVKIYPLEPDDPTPHILALRGLVVFSYEQLVQKEYDEAIRLAPDCVPAHFSMVNARSKKWGRSHEEALAIARAAMSAGQAGSDLPVCLFLAHFHVWQYARVFDKNKPEADRYLEERSVNQELNQALDLWIGNGYQARRSSIPYLHTAALWYYLSGDAIRLKAILALTNNVPYESAWSQLGDPAKIYRYALQTAGLTPKKKSGLLSWLK